MSLTSVLIAALAAIAAFFIGRASAPRKDLLEVKARAYREVSLATDELQSSFLEFVPTGEFRWGDGSMERWKAANQSLNQTLSANRFALPGELIELIEALCWLQPGVGDFEETLRTVGASTTAIREFTRVDFAAK